MNMVGNERLGMDRGRARGGLLERATSRPMGYRRHVAGLGLTLLLGGAGALAASGAGRGGLAGTGWPSPPVAAAQGERPFGLPFAEPPGLGTWYVIQPYGNSVFARQERRGLYRNGQGLHMGLDLAAACGTPVVAIGDGTVRSVDGLGGSPPHNLMIAHGNGLVSFYGHLLERPAVAVGQAVQRGQPVALVGDMYGTCYTSPHLHLEIRDAGLNRLMNPAKLIDADWHSILLLGSAGLAYARDLDDPRRWQAVDDQPDISLGAGLLNDYPHAWPAER
jgi:murein DD-endopeptidase MepM/ murein hydrolase activator NlpD